MFTERDELEMAQWVSEALQNLLRSNLLVPKAIFSQHKIARRRAAQRRDTCHCLW